jgi:hypothetical protein
MKLKSLPFLLSITTMAVAGSVFFPGKAAAFELVSGTTSVDFDTDTLSSVGLEITGTANTVTPVNGFLVGFQITPPPATTFTFDADPNTNQVQPPFSGLIRHTGTITFNRNSANPLTVGNFDIGYDAGRVGGDRSGFFVQDTVSLGAVLFDLREPISDFDGVSLATSLSGELLVSSEFADVLGDARLSGSGIGVASVNGTARAAAAIPEPTTVLGTLASVSFFAFARRRKWTSTRAGSRT